MNTTRQIELVRTSWAAARQQAPALAACFYDRLFQLDPALKAMFKGDMATQHQRLAAMLDTAVGLLDQPGELMPALRNLGRRHAGYGVQEAHYAVVGQALMATLAEMLGDAFTPDMQTAWAQTYGLIAQVMGEAAKSPEAAPSAPAMPRSGVMAAAALVMAGAAAMPVQAQQVGWHPATAQRPAVVAGIDANTFIVGHPASPRLRGGHANFEHPAVLVARGEGRSGVDANTFIVQPPAAVTWLQGPAVADDMARYAQAGRGPVRATE